MISSPDDLALFMSWHVFAVWDFMSLAKRLQADLSCVSTPWLPSKNPLASRLINEIVLAEESDELPAGGYASHFDMYLAAMREVGADSACIEAFIERLREGNDLPRALDLPCIAPAVRRFVTHNLQCAGQGSLHEVLGSFFFGRESIIPAMFQRLLDEWGMDERQAPMFVYYLRRHIELDGDSHGPAALQLIQELLEDQPQAARALLESANQAIDMRVSLWDALAEHIIEQQGLRLAKTGS